MHRIAEWSRDYHIFVEFEDGDEGNLFFVANTYANALIQLGTRVSHIQILRVHLDKSMPTNPSGLVLMNSFDIPLTNADIPRKFDPKLSEAKQLKLQGVVPTNGRLSFGYWYPGLPQRFVEGVFIFDANNYTNQVISPRSQGLYWLGVNRAKGPQFKLCVGSFFDYREDAEGRKTKKWLHSERFANALWPEFRRYWTLLRPFLSSVAFDGDGVLRAIEPIRGNVWPAHASVNLAQRRGAARARIQPLNVNELVGRWIATCSTLLIDVTRQKAAFHHNAFIEVSPCLALDQLYRYITDIHQDLQTLIGGSMGPIRTSGGAVGRRGTRPDFDFTFDPKCLPLLKNALNYLRLMREYCAQPGVLVRFPAYPPVSFGQGADNNSLGQAYGFAREPHYQVRDAISRDFIQHYYLKHERLRPLLFHLSVIREHARVRRIGGSEPPTLAESRGIAKNPLHTIKPRTEKELREKALRLHTRLYGQLAGKQWALARRQTPANRVRSHDYHAFALWDFDRRQVNENGKCEFVQRWERSFKRLMFPTSEPLPPEPKYTTPPPVTPAPPQPFAKAKTVFVIDNTIHPLDPEQEDEEAESLMQEMEAAGKGATKVAYRVLKEYLLYRLGLKGGGISKTAYYIRLFLQARRALKFAEGGDPVDKYIDEKIDCFYKCLNPFKQCDCSEKDDFEDEDDDVEEPEPLTPEKDDEPIQREPTGEEREAEDEVWRKRKCHKWSPFAGPGAATTSGPKTSV